MGEMVWKKERKRLGMGGGNMGKGGKEWDLVWWLYGLMTLAWVIMAMKWVGGGMGDGRGCGMVMRVVEGGG